MKRILMTFAVAAALFGLIVTAGAQAQRGLRGGPGPCVDPIPSDIQGKLLSDFGTQGIDANSDGLLTCEEVKAFFDANPSLRPPRPHGPPPCMDPIPAEIQTRLLADFDDKGIDANSDGTLSCEEVKAFFDANPDLRPPRPHGPPPCMDPIPAEIQTKLLADFGDKGIDANGDGTLTCEEVKAFFDANPDLRPHRGGPRLGDGPRSKAAGDSGSASTAPAAGASGSSSTPRSRKASKNKGK